MANLATSLSTQEAAVFVAALVIWLCQGCGQAFDTKGGDFDKQTIAEIAQEYRQGAQAPQAVTGAASTKRSQAQSTTTLGLELSADLVQSATQLSLIVSEESDPLVDTAVAATVGEAFDLVPGKGGAWNLTLYPGFAPLSQTLATGEQVLEVRLQEPQTADSDEAIIVTRTSEVTLNVTDFDVMTPGLTAFNHSKAIKAGFHGWATTFVDVSVTAGSGAYLDSGLTGIVFEPH